MRYLKKRKQKRIKAFLDARRDMREKNQPLEDFNEKEK